ncbi:OLC1v1001028C2 [Oldenlandia corymbosa var. corymbosa]|uniref:OLC1v1001028C2 n=1 Tax=Oldenlandia corymbosa var. corymbosa TaxID=529605 RepID=A0AAV1D494_OLDCO|nr:OLC1v1001028C2 [Oldenlandia corymbosa var. corymbosa]
MAERAFIVLLIVFMVLSLVHHSAQLQPSQYEALLRIKQQLNFPAELDSWSDNTDFCNSEPNPSLTLVCYEDNLTQLHVAGDTSFSFPQLSEDFSTVALFSNLLSLPNLKVLSLVSLGLKGNLPALIGKLTSLEIVNVSSNYFDGPIPREISYLKNLQTLVMDDNRFTGQVPSWLGSSLPALCVLSMKNNSLSGSLPTTLSLSANLRILVLSGNLLSGVVPHLNNLSNLQVVDLEGNKLGPNFPRLPTRLVNLVLRKNNFKFVKLHELGSFFQLQKLDISMNQFMVPFSQSLFSLPSLTYLDVSGNKFTGKLFKDTPCSPGLSYVNLSENRLTGDLPHCLQYVKNNRTVLFSGNCFSSERYQHQHPPSFCHIEALAVPILPHKQQKKVTSRAVLASSMVGGIVGGMVLLGLVFLVVRRERRKRKSDKVPHTRLIMEKVSPASTLKVLKDASNISETRKLGPVGLPPYRTFVLDELREATNDFSTSNLIVENSNGQVYRGWLTDGTLVAIRCVKMKKKHSVHTYTHHLELIAKLRHIHLVSAIGHCFDCYQDDSSVNKILIVFEHVANGSLRSLISEGNVAQKLTWKQRLAAAIGIGRGIQFLHTGLVPGIYANQLKITDILMDHDYHVKISKYNLPLLDETRKLDNGAISFTGSKEKDGSALRLNEKDDIHDFGVILLEMMVGRAINSVDDVSVSFDILKVNLNAEEPAQRSSVDPAIHNECSDPSLKIMMELCVKCLSSVPSDRPSIEDVLWNLQFAAQVQDSWVRDSSSSSNQGSPIHLT